MSLVAAIPVIVPEQREKVEAFYQSLGLIGRVWLDYGHSEPPRMHLVLHTNSIYEFVERLEQNKIVYHKDHKRDQNEIRLRFEDPLGNPIVVTNAISESLGFGSLGSGSLGSESPSQKIAVLTSGGDAPGMNAAIRAVVRMAIYRQCEVYAVMEGFRGLIEGGTKIERFGWNDVGQIVGQGGTIIRSSRCPEFRGRDGRRQAACNLVKLGIDKLIVIGGDGSLTGADVFRQEWAGLLDELCGRGDIQPSDVDRFRHLMIVGMVGSIDNDMVGTEITIGADSSLHRITEALDSITSTASSHQRAFVIEVMGRHCGWLALNAAIAIGADWLLIPEDPPSHGWEAEMTACLQRNRRIGKTATIVIVAEGAVDRANRPIDGDYVRSVMVANGLDARLTTLGHVQRGGPPSAFDRYLGLVQGVEAVEAVLRADPATTPSILVCMSENKVTCKPLMDCVSETRKVAQAMETLDFPEALSLRNSDFRANYAMWKVLKIVNEHEDVSPPARRLNIAMVNCGAPCGGLNSANRAIVHYCLNKGHGVFGVLNGFMGLARGEFRQMSWIDVDEWSQKGGSMLGTNRSLPDRDLGLVAFYLQRHSIDGLIIVGGFEGFASQLALTKARGTYPAFRIPIVGLPATLSNNVPGTEVSVGSDTALNVIVNACDSLRQSASSSRKRVFVVDVQGGYCGYLATLGGLASGATYSYIHEEGVWLADLQREADHLQCRFTDDVLQGRLIIRNEFCSPIFGPELMAKILEHEGRSFYDARWVSLGHLQQGGSPSPLDRVRATKLAVLCVNFIESCLLDKEEVNATIEDKPALDDTTSVMIGIKGPRVVFTPALKLEAETDIEFRRPRDQWWMPLRAVSKMLAKYPS